MYIYNKKGSVVLKKWVMSLFTVFIATLVLSNGDSVEAREIENTKEIEMSKTL